MGLVTEKLTKFISPFLFSMAKCMHTVGRAFSIYDQFKYILICSNQFCNILPLFYNLVECIV